MAEERPWRCGFECPLTGKLTFRFNLATSASCPPQILVINQRSDTETFNPVIQSAGSLVLSMLSRGFRDSLHIERARYQYVRR